MTVFVDTGVFVAFHNTRDANHREALDLMRRIAEGDFGAAYTSDYVFDEAVTVALVRTGNPGNALAVGGMILGEAIGPFLSVLRVGEDRFEEAWGLFPRYAARGLSFTDCTSVALMEAREIDAMASFDSDFDGIVPRLASR